MSGNRNIEKLELWELTRDEAQDVLDTFLRVEREAFPDWKNEFAVMDYSSDSVEKCLFDILSKIMNGALSEEDKNLWFTRLGFYMGEALRNANPRLFWALGDVDYAFANHPVIAGFAEEEEAPTITICRNLITSVAEGRSPPSRIQNGVRSWFGKLNN